MKSVIECLALMIWLGPAARAAELKPRRWVVYYSDKAPASDFASYDLVVLDSKYHPPVAQVKDGTKVVLGYLSLGEVNHDRNYFAAVKAEGLLIQENKNWPGSFMVDLRERRWRQRVVEELVPAILQQGFDGLFLDTLDNAAYLEESSPARFQGMRQAAVDLVRTLRTEYPSIRIAINRGYDLLEQVAPYVDLAAAESLLATYDFSAKRYVPVAPQISAPQVRRLQAVMRDHPRVQVLSLDYWDPSDPEGARRIYRRELKNGFCPYVATIGLNEIIREP